MKKIILIIFLIIFSFFPKNIFASTNSWSIENHTISDFMLKRKENIENVLNNSDSTLEKQYNNINNNLNSKKNNWDISKEVLENLQKQFNDLNKTINEKNQEIKELTEKDSKKTKREINELEKKKIELEKKILVEKNKVLALEWEISELEIYKKRYEKLVVEQNKEKIREREQNLAIYLWIFLTYLIISWLSLRFIKNSQKKSFFNIISLAIFILSIIIFTLVINPWFVIIFIIIAWSVVLAFKDFIVSFIASILILRRCKIWDLVEIEWKKWTINKISALNTTLLTDTWEIFLLNNFLISKPLKLVESEKESIKVKIIISKNEIKEKIKNIKNIFSKDEINISLTEKEDWRVELEIDLNWFEITKKIEKIF